MGSTSIGRAFDAGLDRVGNTFGGTMGDLIKDPKRMLTAVGTMGMSELGNAIDNKLFNDPRNKGEDAATKGVAAANKMLGEREEEIAQQGRIKERDLARARSRSMSAGLGGRNSTILTGRGSSYSSGGKTLLGQ